MYVCSNDCSMRVFLSMFWYQSIFVLFVWVLPLYIPIRHNYQAGSDLSQTGIGQRVGFLNRNWNGDKCAQLGMTTVLAPIGTRPVKLRTGIGQRAGFLIRMGISAGWFRVHFYKNRVSNQLQIILKTKIKTGLFDY